MENDRNAKGQYRDYIGTISGLYQDYDKVGATLITGNEDGVKHCAMNSLFSLLPIGYAVAPQADAGWMGETSPALHIRMQISTDQRMISRTATRLFLYGILCTWREC